MPHTVMSCSDASVPFAVIFGVFAVLICMTCCAGFFVWRHRRISNDYVRLEKEFNDMHIELNESGGQKLEE